MPLHRLDLSSLASAPIHSRKKIGTTSKHQPLSKRVTLVEHLSHERPAQVIDLFHRTRSVLVTAFRWCLEIASDALKGRVFEASLGDLVKHDDEDSYRKFKLICEDVQGRHCLTNFHGMDITTDRLRMLVKKWQVNSSISSVKEEPTHSIASFRHWSRLTLIFVHPTDISCESSALVSPWKCVVKSERPAMPNTRKSVMTIFDERRSNPLDIF